ncbi:MAG TPA: ABC transporter ATP-binding protein [Acidimicrobiales bacterium]|nr:ABC transporter ATP-binding protein [Acidimicrobiales bacterium]
MSAASPSAVAVPALPGDGDHVIVTQALTKAYAGGKVAVDGLDLTVGRGEIFALLGPNGAGKTTTVGMLTTRVVPTSGSVLVNGVDVVRHPATAKASLGVVGQYNTLDQRLTVWENLYFHGRYFGLRSRPAKAAADDMLERFRLTGRGRAEVMTLSGGMARRLMLARAFLPRPAVVFLDEPTAGLDPQSRIALWEIVGDLHAEGETILLTTHYLEEADRLAQRVAIMDHGRLVALDTPERLRRSLATGTVVSIRALGDLDILAACLRQLPGVEDTSHVGGELLVRLRSEQEVAEVVAATARHGFSLQNLAVAEASLETVFLSLTGSELRE